MGSELFKLEQQSKKLRKLVREAIEEDFYMKKPSIRVARERFRTVLLEADKRFDQTIYEGTMKLKHKALQRWLDTKQLFKS